MVALCFPGVARADLLVREVLIPYEQGDAEGKHSASLFMFGMVGALYGVNDVTYHETGRKVFCLDDPEAMGAHGYFAVLADYVRAHPDARDMNAGLVFARAMAERYPCPK